MAVTNRYRVALIGIYHESNTFSDGRTTIEDFRKSHLLKGEEIRREYLQAYHEIGGMLEIMDAGGIEVVPLLYAEATPGGVVAATAYQELIDEMTTRLVGIIPIDGCLVVPHGAGASEYYPDMDGHWLTKIRELVGPEVPIVGTLDPHANLSQAMVDATDALVAYKTNPHIDQRQTGKAAAELLKKCLQKKIKPHQYLIKPPVTISIEQQYTSAYPCTLLYDSASRLEKQTGILSISILLGFPYADMEKTGTSFLVISDDDPELGKQTGETLSQLTVKNRHVFVAKKESVDIQAAKLSHMEKPVLWLDMGDNVGGGAPGDSAFLLNILESMEHLHAFACIYDPKAVARMRGYDIGSQLVLEFGNDYRYGSLGKPYQTRVTLLAEADGKFREDTPRHGGQVQYDMGDSLILETRAGNTVMLHSLRVPPFSLNQLTTFGIDPAVFDVIIAKGVNAPIAAYAPVCRTILQADTPGVTQADMTKLRFQHRRRPLFPFEEIADNEQ